MERVHSDGQLALSNHNTKNSIIEGGIDKHPYRCLIFSPNVDENLFKKHLIITHKGLTYSAYSLKGPSESFLKYKQVELKALPGNKEGKKLPNSNNQNP
jgi:CTD small phosphatase-like protein 2